MGKKKVPELRFKGFRGDWESKKFSDFIELRKENGNQEDYCIDIELENLVTDIGTVVGDTSIRTQSTSVFRENDTLFGRLRPYLNKWWLADCDGVKSGEIWALKNTKISESVFVFSTVQTKIFLESANISSGTKMPRADWSKVANDSMKIPRISEQTAIGNLFRSLDSLISLQSKKHDKLKTIKKAMLGKMFPKDGTHVPEIRFAGFSGDWKRKRLGEVAPLRGGYSFQSENFKKHGVPIIRISNILSSGSVGGEYVYYSEQENDDNYFLPNGAALLAMSGATTGKVAVLKKTGNSKFYQNQRVGYFSDTETVEYSFIETLVGSKLFLNQLESVLVAGAQPNVSSKEIDSFEFYFPCDKKEQTAIGNFFQNLDSLITLENQKLEKLKTIKKSLLDKMFV